MEIAIQLVWWIGLIGALIATVVVLKEVALVLRELQAIHELAERTRGASRQLAGAAAAAPRLRGLDEPGRDLCRAAADFRDAAAALDLKLTALAEGAAPEG